MTISEESRIRDAIRRNDGELLAATVRNSRFMDYDELEQFVNDQPGGWRHANWRGIEIDDVTVVNRYGRPVVQS